MKYLRIAVVLLGVVLYWSTRETISYTVDVPHKKEFASKTEMQLWYDANVKASTATVVDTKADEITTIDMIK